MPDQPEPATLEHRRVPGAGSAKGTHCSCGIVWPCTIGADRAVLRRLAADAVRSAACPGSDCPYTEEECTARRIQPAAWELGVLSEVHGRPEWFADAMLSVLPIVQADLTRRADLAEAAIRNVRELAAAVDDPDWRAPGTEVAGRIRLALSHDSPAVLRPAAGFARGFRLHHRGAVLHGAQFPGDGHVVLLDLEDAYFATGAPTLDQLLLHYPGAHVQWADQSGDTPAPVVHPGDEQQASTPPGVDESGQDPVDAAHMRAELEQVQAAVDRVRAATARMRVQSRTWHPAADLVDAALLGTTASSEPGPEDADNEPGRRTARRRDMADLLTQAVSTGTVDANRLWEYAWSEMAEADIARSILADHRVETQAVRAKLEEARRQAGLSDSVTAATKELLARRTATLRERAARAEARIERTVKQMEAYAAAGSGGVNPHQVIGLLSPTWPDGNHEAAAPGETATLRTDTRP
ncbi:hypothetical protein ACFXKG_18385 [Streptomyces sp. NPDC059255]|uniref:hypothetical protein n=1 Tax=Streptomyces sp. NPDC059255 TaxID=3346793 RepID=UPI0036BC274A